MFRLPENRCRGIVRDISDAPEFLCVIDQFDSKDFNENEAGHIRNDISQLARATSQSQYESIMRRLVEIKSEGGIPEGTRVEDAIAMIKPRYAQSPNEIEQFIQWTNGNVMEKLDAAYRKSLEKEVKPDVQPAVETSPASAASE